MVRRETTVLLALASFLALSTGVALAAHLWVEGPDHDFDEQDCPICRQLTFGSTTVVGDASLATCCDEATFLYLYPPPSVELRADTCDFQIRSPRAPPTF